MDNVGDWIYIVFLIIAGISSLFGSKDKKKKKSRSKTLGQPEPDVVPNEQDNKEKGFWEILEDMQKEVEKPTPKPQPRKKRKLKTKPQIIEEDPTPKPQPAPFLTAESIIPDHTASLSTMQAPSTEEEPSSMPEDTFKDMGELRKAIIYAEIINRKY